MTRCNVWPMGGGGKRVYDVMLRYVTRKSIELVDITNPRPLNEKNKKTFRK